MIREGLDLLLGSAPEFGIQVAGFNAVGLPVNEEKCITFNGSEEQGFGGLILKKFINSKDEVQYIQTQGGEYHIFVAAFLELCTEVL